MIKVINLATLDEVSYSLGPKEAVNAAFEQYTKRNWSTWTYHKSLHLVIECERSFCRGEWAALKAQPKMTLNADATKTSIADPAGALPEQGTIAR